MSQRHDDRNTRVGSARRAFAALLSAAAVASILWSCGGLQPDSDRFGAASTDGSLSVRLESTIAANTVQPPLDMTIKSFLVTLSGAGDTVSRTIPSGRKSITFASLAAGAWTVTVHAENRDKPPVIVATGQQSVNVAGGATTTVTVDVTPVHGDGSLNLALTWPAGVLINPAVEATLTSQPGPTQDISALFAVVSGPDTQTATYAGTWDSGYYVLALALTDDGTQVWGDTVAVRIITGQTSVGHYALAETQLNPLQTVGAVEANVGATLATRAQSR